MDKAELEKDFPELAAELRAEGAKAERGRYDSHVALGRQSGALAMALADYEAGKAVTVTMAAHMDFAMRGRAIQDRLDDDVVAAEATNGAAGQREPDGNTALAAAVTRITGGGNHMVHR